MTSQRLRIQCCDSLANPAVDYTYFQDTLGRFSVIDHMFVKFDTFNNVINYSTIESGYNLSDHAPISCVIAMVEPSRNSRKTKLSTTARPIKTLRQSRLRWDKGDVAMYYQKTGERLQNLNIPCELLRGQCADSNCN